MTGWLRHGAVSVLLIGLATSLQAAAAPDAFVAPESLIAKKVHGDGLDGDLNDSVYLSADTGGSTWQAQQEATKLQHAKQLETVEALRAKLKKAERDAGVREEAQEAVSRRTDKVKTGVAPKQNAEWLQTDEGSSTQLGSESQKSQRIRSSSGSSSSMMRRETDPPVTEAMRSSQEQDDLERTQWWGHTSVMPKFDRADQDRQQILSDRDPSVYTETSDHKLLIHSGDQEDDSSISTNPGDMAGQRASADLVQDAAGSVAAQNAGYPDTDLDSANALAQSAIPAATDPNMDTESANSNKVSLHSDRQQQEADEEAGPEAPPTSEEELNARSQADADMRDAAGRRAHEQDQAAGNAFVGAPAGQQSLGFVQEHSGFPGRQRGYPFPYHSASPPDAAGLWWQQKGYESSDLTRHRNTPADSDGSARWQQKEYADNRGTSNDDADTADAAEASRQVLAMQQASGTNSEQGKDPSDSSLLEIRGNGKAVQPKSVKALKTKDVTVKASKPPSAKTVVKTVLHKPAAAPKAKELTAKGSKAPAAKIVKPVLAKLAKAPLAKTVKKTILHKPAAAPKAKELTTKRSKVPAAAVVKPVLKKLAETTNAKIAKTVVKTVLHKPVVALKAKVLTTKGSKTAAAKIVKPVLAKLSKAAPAKTVVKTVLHKPVAAPKAKVLTVKGSKATPAKAVVKKTVLHKPVATPKAKELTSKGSKAQPAPNKLAEAPKAKDVKLKAFHVKEPSVKQVAKTAKKPVAAAKAVVKPATQTVKAAKAPEAKANELTVKALAQRPKRK